MTPLRALYIKAASFGIGLAGIVVLFGCSTPDSEIHPIQNSGPPRRAIEERPPELVSPEQVRQTPEEAARERERLGIGGEADPGRRQGGGGGGSADDWVPHTAERPNRREVEAFQRRLEAEIADEVDPDDGACEQFRSTWAASVAAGGRAGGAPPTPSRAQMRRGCRAMPAGYLRCMDREYFDEHREECQREIQALARRGNRRSDEARQQLDEIERGRRPPPDQPERPEEERL